MAPLMNVIVVVQNAPFEAVNGKSGEVKEVSQFKPASFCHKAAERRRCCESRSFSVIFLATPFFKHHN